MYISTCIYLILSYLICNFLLLTKSGHILRDSQPLHRFIASHVTGRRWFPHVQSFPQSLWPVFFYFVRSFKQKIWETSWNVSHHLNQLPFLSIKSTNLHRGFRFAIGLAPVLSSDFFRILGFSKTKIQPSRARWLGHLGADQAQTLQEDSHPSSHARPWKRETTSFTEP